MLTPRAVFYLFGPCPGHALLRRPRRATPSDQTRGLHREVPVGRRCFGLHHASGGRMPVCRSLTIKYGRKGNAGGGVLADAPASATRSGRRQDSGRSAFHTPSQARVVLGQPGRSSVLCEGARYAVILRVTSSKPNQNQSFNLRV